jgi:pyrroloquinoline-quinone synthase
MSDVVARIDELVATRRLLDHPFYVAWSKGELTPEALRLYAAQYYQWVRAFPTWLSAAHSNASELAMRQEILENLIDEERGPENHPELWLRFCDALGLSRGDVAATDPLPETAEALAAMREVCRRESAVAALAALYAYETQQPEVMQTKRNGLRDLYGVTTGHEYFTVHETLDVEHSAGERTLIAAYAAGHEAAVLRAAQVAVDASNRILDGVNRCRESMS